MTDAPASPMSRGVANRRQLLIGLLSGGFVGCNALKMHMQSTERPANNAVPPVPPLPTRYSFRIAPYIFHSDFELKRDLPLFSELATLRDQVYKQLQLPTGTAAVQVYLFEDRERYERFMQARYPSLPRRRAFFVAQPRAMGGPDDLLVYTFWGDRIQQDLRHELTHALLHSVLREVPLWLDEGLAEFFELPPANNGINAAHVENLRRAPGGPERFDLARLEGLSQVDQMTPAEYREAWAWVHFLLRGQPEAKALLIAYLQQLRTNPNPGPLGPRLAALYPSPRDALERHLAAIELPPRANRTIAER